MAFTVQSSKLPIWGKRRGRLSLIFQCGVQEDKGIAAIEFALFLPLLLILLLEESPPLNLLSFYHFCSSSS
jgi:hypothetical protein